MNHSGIEIWQGDCFELMGKIADQSVDAIITDPPYGTTRLEWDQKIDLAAWWEAAGRVIKPSGVIAMFAAQPFATDLINSNRKWFRYELIWRKSRAVGFLDANKRPLRAHENILIFSRYFKRSNDGKRAASTYNPQFTLGKPYKKSGGLNHTAHYGKVIEQPARENDGRRYPVDVLDFASDNNARSLHPTQKPLELVKWLVLTYTNAGELVLDPFAGSGTTLVACKYEDRCAIGIEQSEKHINVCLSRLE
jgi:site-specific DNA-methyltransferase (adenine-specific)